MGQDYRIDRLHIVSYNGQRKKEIREVRCRYLAKSHLINCAANGKRFDYVNFRGSHFKKVDFSNAVFYGCDFWGASFNKCNFRGAKISDCVFMASKFSDCRFDNATLEYSTVVNTSLLECHNIFLSKSVEVLAQYPHCECAPSLDAALEVLKGNINLRKNKLLHIPGNKVNMLNLYLLQKRFQADELSELLLRLNERSTKTITTYKKLEMALIAQKKMV